MSPRLSTFGLLAAVALAMPAFSAARAADLDDYGYADAPQEMPVAQLPQARVEFGTGWYVRGDLGVARVPTLSLSDPSTDYQSPSTTYGQGPRAGYDASLGAGYSFNRFFRSDIMADFHDPLKINQYGHFYSAATQRCQVGQDTIITTGQVATYYEDCSSNYDAGIHSWDVLANAYFDIGHFGIFTPYVGVGVGLAFGHYSSSVAYTQDDGTPYNLYYTDQGTGQSFHGYHDVVNQGYYYNFAYAAMAGVAIDVYAHTKLDIGYRYLNQGRVLGSTIQTHEVRAGLRYMIDN